MPELKPCPFCGSTNAIERETVTYQWVCLCDNCGASTAVYDEKDEAIEAWNRRVENEVD